jgi:hypothetical protein
MSGGKEVVLHVSQFPRDFTPLQESEDADNLS